MTPKRMVTKKFMLDTAHHILGSDWSHTCKTGPVLKGVRPALLRAHRSPGLRPTSHGIWF